VFKIWIRNRFISALHKSLSDTRLDQSRRDMDEAFGRALAWPRKSLRQIREETIGALTPGHLATYQRIIKRIGDLKIREQALKPGTPIPDFVLPDSEGRLVRRNQLAYGPLAIRFCCGEWCPFCMAELKQLTLILPEIHDLDAELIVITPEIGRFPREMKRKFGLDALKILSDVDLGVSLAFGLLYPVPNDVRSFFVETGFDLSKRHGSEGWLLPAPGTFIVGRDGLVFDVRAEAEILDRYEPEDVVRLLEKAHRLA
jgi:peroxiredoxin